MLRTCLLLVAAATAYGRQFEVASIRPSPPPRVEWIRVAMDGGPGTPDPGRINYENVTLKMLLAKAYGIQDYQISGPDWLESETFNIAAKLPDDATKEQFLAMLRNLLIERFKLSMYREKKDFPAYALLVAKNGPKIKTSTADSATAGEARASAPPAMSKLGKDGFPEVPPGGHGPSMITMNDRAKMVAAGMSMAALVEQLSGQLGSPVSDLTGLTGKYDFTLYFSQERSIVRPPQPDADAAPSLPIALQEQLGLRLESRKALLDLIVVEHIEKAPTEN